jgi:hypothetical protein
MIHYRIDYNRKGIVLHYNGEDFVFDLNDGDIGDFWDSFITADGVVKDVNFYQEDSTCEPSFTIYAVIKDEKGELNIDTSDYIYVEDYDVIGDSSNYFE